MMAAFRRLAWLRPERGTAFDIFGYTEEGSAEWGIIPEVYQRLRMLCHTFTPASLSEAVAQADLPQMIRGNGHVKAAAIRVYREALKQAILEAPQRLSASSGV